jgi:hypothetical protein
MRRAEIVRANAAQLFLAEDAVDKALVEVAKLAQMLSDSRLQTKLSAVVGQDAIDGIATLYRRLSKARRDAVALHKLLDDVKTQIGARTVMVGGDNGKPPPPQTGRLIIEVAREEAA